MIQIARWKATLVAVVVSLGILFILPNFFPRSQVESWPDWFPNQQISLRLDLEGGSHLLLEIEIGAVLRERLDGLVSEIRVMLRGAEPRIPYAGLGRDGDTVKVKIRDRSDFNRAVKLLNELARPIGSSNKFINSSRRENRP